MISNEYYFSHLAMNKQRSNDKVNSKALVSKLVAHPAAPGLPPYSMSLSNTSQRIDMPQ